MIHSLAKAYKEERLVIVVGTSDGFKYQAIAHAEKLASWFRANEHIGAVSVIAHKMGEEGVFYVYCLPDGLPYKHKESASTGTLSVQQSVELRTDVVIGYRAAMAINESGTGYLD